MPARETKTITTPAGHAVLLNTYLTGRENNELKRAIYGSIGVKDGEADASAVTGALLLDQQKAALGYLLVQFDTLTGDEALNALLDLPSAEYEFVIAEIDKITNPFQPGK